MTVKEVCESSLVKNVILIVIAMNAVTLGLETSQFFEKHMGMFLLVCDKIFLAIFTLEIGGKIYAYKKDYFKDPWNVFDFLIVAISYVPASGALTVFRSLRILRLLLVISFLPRLRLIVQSLLYALPGIGWISLLLLILFYIFGVMATRMFGTAFPEWFGTLGASFFTLFQIMTLESWAMGLVRPISQLYPYAFLFFIPFVLISSFVVLNVFIAIIINGMSEARKKLSEETPPQIQVSVKTREMTVISQITEAGEVDKLKDELETLRNQIQALDGHLAKLLGKNKN